MEKSDFINLIYSYREKQFSIMLKSYKYRMYPTDNQKEMLSNIFGQVRFVYNLGLETKISAYLGSKKNIEYFDLNKQITELKNTDATWLKEAPSQALQMSMRNLDNAYTSFFKGGGFPKFKSKYGKQSFQLPQGVFLSDDTKGLLNNIRPDGRITCGVNNFNTSTGRSSQSLFVNCPSESALYGEKLRGSLVAGEGNILVGADMRSCQLALAAYYSNNFDYYMAVATGNEFKLNEDGSEMLHPVSGKPWYIGESGHCVSARAFGLVTEEEWKTAVEKQDQELIHKLHLVRKHLHILIV